MPASSPSPPTDPAPLDYASPVPDALEITRNEDATGDGGEIVIRVPPPDVATQVLRIVAWSVGLAALGMSAALRLLSVRPRGFLVLFVAHASFLPAIFAALLAGVCVWMIVRIARFGRRPMTIAVGDDGLYIDNPTRLLPRTRHIPFERFATIEQPERAQQLQVGLRDGIPFALPMLEADKPRVLAAVAEEVRRRRPMTHTKTVDRIGRVTSTLIPPKRFMRDEALHGQLETFADGIRWTVTPARGWVMLHIIEAGFFMWVAVVISGFIYPPLPTFTFVQWTAAYAAMMLLMFMHEPPSQRGRHPKDVVIDVIEDTLVLRDADYHGGRDRWRREEIAAIEIGGPMWWLARGGGLRVRLRDGTRITLLHAQPLCVLKPVAHELRRALGLVTAASDASPPHERE